MEHLPVDRSSTVLRPDLTRVVLRPYRPGDVGPNGGRSRIAGLIDRVLALPEDRVGPCLASVHERFQDRHRDLHEQFERSYQEARGLVDIPEGLSAEVRELIGAFLLHEYSLEAAALTNPAIVAAPDQSGAGPGCLRVIVSLRAIGEGHISSIELRTGTIDADGEVHLDAPRPAILGHRRAPLFERTAFTASLAELVADDGSFERPPSGFDPDETPDRGPMRQLLEPLPERFTLAELEDVLRRDPPTGEDADVLALARSTIHWLAASNYELWFPVGSHLSQRVLFPAGPSESHGMEDARLTRFTRDDGSAIYYGTYTAYDGFHILPQLIETQDFSTFRIATLSGRAARNKGIAIFPRKINGRFAALARSDAENNFLMYSDHIRVWDDLELLQVPVQPWELLQIGNAGSPIETDEGWLVITHGVGPMRTYALGAMLLDLDDPSVVIGHLPEPLLFPQEDERDGYVPNVVYSCGQIVHAGKLVLAYGASDTATRFATVPLDTLLHELTSPSSAVSR